jgi:citrate lyase synthetase
MITFIFELPLKRNGTYYMSEASFNEYLTKPKFEEVLNRYITVELNIFGGRFIKFEV